MLRMTLTERKCEKEHAEIQRAVGQAEDAEDAPRGQSWAMWRHKMIGRLLSKCVQIIAFSVVVVSVAAGLTPVVRVSAFTAFSLSMSVMTARHQRLSTTELLSIFRLRLDVWKPVRVCLWAILTLSGGLSLAEKVGIVEFPFLPTASDEVVRTFHLSVLGQILFLAKMVFELLPQYAWSLAEITAISEKTSYIERRLMAIGFYATHEVIRQLVQLFGVFNVTMDGSGNYLYRHAQAIISRAEMSWRAAGVSGMRCELLRKLVILKAKEQCLAFKECELNQDECFPGILTKAQLRPHMDYFMNEDFLKTGEDMHNIEDAIEAVTQTIMSDPEFPHILKPEH